MQNIVRENYQPPRQVRDAETSLRGPRIQETDPVGSYDEPELETRWIYLKADAPKKITEEVLLAFRDKRAVLEADIRQDLAVGRKPRVGYMVLSSQRPGIFNLGGDLKLFKEKIEANDREGLKRYAKECIDFVYDTAMGFHLPLTTIALVRGTAQGGGFEGALAHNVVVAERQSQMGLPEIMFNLFPGMGAYQLLCRRLPAVTAEKIILSGKTYSAEELYEMGLVDVLADEGQGEEAVRTYIRQARSKQNGRDALRRMIRQVDPLQYEDLLRSIDVWVDAAFNLSDGDLKTMDFLLRAQQRMGY